MTVRPSKRRLAIDLLIRTDPELVDEDALPIAGGSAAPALPRAGAGVATLGVKDMARIAGFADAIAGETPTDGLGELALLKRRFSQALGADVDGVLEQLSGDTVLTRDREGEIALRATLRDPARVASALTDSAQALPAALEELGMAGAQLVSPPDGVGLYTLTLPDGRSFAYGVIDRTFVLASDAVRATELAGARVGRDPGARGSVVLRGDARTVASALRGPLGRSSLALLRAFRSTSGWLAASPTRVRGRLVLVAP